MRDLTDFRHKLASEADAIPETLYVTFIVSYQSDPTKCIDLHCPGGLSAAKAKLDPTQQVHMLWGVMPHGKCYLQPT
jgi:hypothetical protein